MLENRDKMLPTVLKKNTLLIKDIGVQKIVIINNTYPYTVLENRDKMLLVMEYAEGGELYDYIADKIRLEEAEARRLFRQIAAAIYYCHKVIFYFLSIDRLELSSHYISY